MTSLWEYVQMIIWLIFDLSFLCPSLTCLLESWFTWGLGAAAVMMMFLNDSLQIRQITICNLLAFFFLCEEIQTEMCCCLIQSPQRVMAWIFLGRLLHSLTVGLRLLAIVLPSLTIPFPLPILLSHFVRWSETHVREPKVFPRNTKLQGGDAKLLQGNKSIARDRKTISREQESIVREHKTIVRARKQYCKVLRNYSRKQINIAKEQKRLWKGCKTVVRG